MPRVELDVAELVSRLAPLAVEGVRPLHGGASSLTYVAERAGGELSVVKVAPAGVPAVGHRDVLRQARLLRALRPTPVPVPQVLWGDPGASSDEPPLFVMEFVHGTSLEPLFDRDGDEEERVVAERMRNAARTMAALHALPPEELDLASEPSITLAEEIDRWCRLLETVDPALAPGWEPVARALRATLPTPLPAAVVHGDFRLGNMLGVAHHIAAVIDWEIWSVADPRVDVGWFLVNADPATYRRATRYEHSLPTPAELSDIYADSLGRALVDLEWFQALACFKSTATWSLIIKHNRRRRLPDPSVEELAGTLPRLLARADELLG